LDKTKYDMKDGLLFYRGRLYISDFSALKNQLLHLSHGGPRAGLGVSKKTEKKLNRENKKKLTEKTKPRKKNLTD